MEKKAKKMSEPFCVDESYYYPEIVRFNVNQLPEIKNWEVGKEYTIIIKAKMTGYEQRKLDNEMMGKKEKEEAKFEITAVKPEDGGLNKGQKKVMDFMTNK
jgi:hypothetical protein